MPSHSASVTAEDLLWIPDDTAIRVEAAIDAFLSAVARLFWVLNPELEIVRIFRADSTASTLRANDDLNGENVLPGFRCRVSELFAMPGS